MARVVLAILMLALMVYALIDCIRTPSDNMPGKLPKFLWILLVLLLNPIGPIAWIIVSRVAAAEAKGGRVVPTVWSSEESVPLKFGRDKEPVSPTSPDDDPEFLEEVSRRLREKQRQEYQRKKRESENSTAEEAENEETRNLEQTEPEEREN